MCRCKSEIFTPKRISFTFIVHKSLDSWNLNFQWNLRHAHYSFAMNMLLHLIRMFVWCRWRNGWFRCHVMPKCIFSDRDRERQTCQWSRIYHMLTLRFFNDDDSWFCETFSSWKMADSEGKLHEIRCHRVLS